MTTAFVAGATGYTGREVVRQLSVAGTSAIAHVRPDSPALAEWRTRFKAMGAVVDTTPWDEEALTEALRRHEVDLVFALLGTTRARARAAKQAGGATADYETVDYSLTHMLLNAVRKARPTAHFMYLSAIGARTDTANEYLRVRGRIEQELCPSGITYSVARPGLITGDDRTERRPLEQAAAVVLTTASSLLGAVGARGTADRLLPISAERLARALIDIATDPRAANCVVKSAELQRRGQP